MVSALDSGSRGPGWSPGRVIVLCSWERRFTLTVPLSTKECKWVPAGFQGNRNAGGVTCDGLASRPGGVAILVVASCYGNRENHRQCWPLGSCTDFTFYLYSCCKLIARERTRNVYILV